jgi:hypothetical protein
VKQETFLEGRVIAAPPRSRIAATVEERTVQGIVEDVAVHIESYDDVDKDLLVSQFVLSDLAMLCTCYFLVPIRHADDPNPVLYRSVSCQIMFTAPGSIANVSCFFRACFSMVSTNEIRKNDCVTNH